MWLEQAYSKLATYQVTARISKPLLPPLLSLLPPPLLATPWHATTCAAACLRCRRHLPGALLCSSSSPSSPSSPSSTCT